MLLEPRCSERGCKHFRGVREDADRSELSDRVICAAFPDGIPPEIAYGDNPHTEPVPGDHGIRFEPGAPAEEQ